MSVRTIIAVRDSPTIDRLYYNHLESPDVLGGFLVRALLSARVKEVQAGYPNIDALVEHIHSLEPRLQFDDRHITCHPSNVQYVFPTVQRDLEYVFEIEYEERHSSITLYKTYHNWNDEGAPQFAYKVFESYVDALGFDNVWRSYFGSDEDYDFTKFEGAVNTAQIIESFYNAAPSAEIYTEEARAKRLFKLTGASSHDDLTDDLSKIE